MTILYFIIALGILVLVHEWGHFIVAKKSGIRVEEFSIGFGPKIFGFHYDGTDFKISPIPLGGYVKLYGEDPVGESDGDEAKANAIASSPDAFSAAPMRAKLATVMAGPAMNIILCFLLMPIVFMLGRQVPAIMEETPVILGVQPDSPAEKLGLVEGDVIISLNGVPATTWTDVLHTVLINPNNSISLVYKRNAETKEVILPLVVSPQTDQMVGYAGFEPQYFWGNEPIVGQVNNNSPAAKAGLQERDIILSINDTPIQKWDDLTKIVRGSGGQELTVKYSREGVTQIVSLLPELNEATAGYIIGIGKYVDPKMFVKKKYDFVPAVQAGAQEVVKLFDMTVDVLKRLLSFNLSYKALGGPLQIAQASGQAAKAGFSEFIYFLAFLSLQLGVLNLLPIPVLDGGHVFFMAVEGVMRRPIPIKVKSALVSGGMFLLLGLMVLITINDLDRMLGFAELWTKIKGYF